MSRNIGSKIRATLAVLFVAAFFVYFNILNVLAVATVSTSNVQTWGTGGLISFNISGVSVGEVINVNITTPGTILYAYDNVGSNILIYGESVACQVTVTDPNMSYYQVAVEGVDITGLSASVWISQPEEPTEPAPPPSEEPVTEPAPVEQTSPAEPVSETPTEPQPAQPVQTTQTSATTAATTEAETVEEAEAASEESSEDESTETTVPLVVMNADGNLVVVTPTPTSFPYMESRTFDFNDKEFEFPIRYVVGSLIIIAILGTRFVLLRNRGLRGKNLAIEFIPTIADIHDKRQWKKSQEIFKKREEARAKKEHDGSNAASARAAEAAREAQIARAEMMREAQERKEAAQALANSRTSSSGKSSSGTGASRSAVPGKPTAKRPPAPKGIQTAPGFKFTVPVPEPISQEELQINRPSPFKTISKPEPVKPEPVISEPVKTDKLKPENMPTDIKMPVHPKSSGAQAKKKPTIPKPPTRNKTTGSGSEE